LRRGTSASTDDFLQISHFADIPPILGEHPKAKNAGIGCNSSMKIRHRKFKQAGHGEPRGASPTRYIPDGFVDASD